MVLEDTIYPNNTIRIGENATDNDQIIKEAHENDVWFHLSSLPSCHVIISCSKKYPLTKQMVNYCASLVKEHGKYKNISKVTISYTEIKNVKRTIIPGQVTIKNKVKSLRV